MKQGLDEFIVESTPVLDLKKQSIDTESHTPHISEPGWDADRTEVYADIDESDAIAALTSESGESYPITTFPFVMGRGSECDLVLQGKGISRKHAEIVFQSGRFVINDLESLNGLKVNGYKVARVILEEEDTIKLGEVSLTFNSGASKASNAASEETVAPSGLFKKKASTDQAEDDTFGPSPTKKLFTNIVILMAVAIFAAAGYVYLNKNSADQMAVIPSANKSPVPANTPKPANRTPSVQNNPVAQSPVATASTSDPKPKVSATAPPPPSALAPPPSIAMAKPAETKPPAPTSVEPSAVSAPPPVAKPKPRPKVVNLNGKAEVAMSKAERLYFGGNGAEALKELKPYVSSGSVTGATKKNVRTSYQNIEFLFGQYNQAQTSFDRGDKEAAFSLWTDFMAREQQLYSGKKSTYTRTIASKVMDEYVARGNAASAKGDYHTAYNDWQKALKIGDSVPAQLALDNLNTKAQQLYRQALRLEYVNSTKAKAMWREVTQLLPPGTEYHTKASSKLAWYEKWGS